MEPVFRVFANPLLDAWVVAQNGEEPCVLPVNRGRDGRSPLDKVGEALMFTTLIAPANRAEGPLSRFTCETCHFEGYVDGRTHHTGRKNVRATTKPLVGLLNNRPYFSRALDPDLTAVVHNEFRVAGANSHHDPWFELEVGDHPWLRELGVEQSQLSPGELRRALLSQLARLSHPPNPRTLGRSAFDNEEQRGAQLFLEHCEGCHQARRFSDVPGTRVEFEDWPHSIFGAAGGLVWGSAAYCKTGIEPYVHELGARVPSLRRLYKKFPYFTNGSASSLEEVLERVRFEPSAFYHDAGSRHDLEALSPAAQHALIAFIELL